VILTQQSDRLLCRPWRFCRSLIGPWLINLWFVNLWHIDAWLISL
jgi:hypothetical protein